MEIGISAEEIEVRVWYKSGKILLELDEELCYMIFYVLRDFCIIMYCCGRCVFVFFPDALDTDKLFCLNRPMEMPDFIDLDLGMDWIWASPCPECRLCRLFPRHPP